MFVYLSACRLSRNMLPLSVTLAELHNQREPTFDTKWHPFHYYEAVSSLQNRP
jgi:hypothetical protein